MIICVGCRKEMRCDKNSVGADFGNGHVYPADRFRCPVCGAMVLVSNLKPSFDPEYSFQEEYLDMNKPKDLGSHLFNTAVAINNAYKEGLKNGR
jgi:hypothetical protein